jgi:hypothetical protein
MLPAAAGKNPASVRSSVVLPDPFGPRSKSAVPARTSNDTPATTICVPLWQARPSAAIDSTAFAWSTGGFALLAGSILAKDFTRMICFRRPSLW